VDSLPRILEKRPVTTENIARVSSELFDRLAAMGILHAGTRKLDLGTGTGTIARSLAQRGCESIGLQALLAEKFPQEPLAVLHRVFAAIGKAPE
jgi:hypothetical protein